MIPTITGSTEIEYEQVICTNRVCQAQQDEVIKKEATKREEVRVQKEVRDKERKALNVRVKENKILQNLSRI